MRGIRVGEASNSGPPQVVELWPDLPGARRVTGVPTERDQIWDFVHLSRRICIAQFDLTRLDS